MLSSSPATSRSSILKAIRSPFLQDLRRAGDLAQLEKDGIPIAGVMDIDEFEDYLELQDPRVREHIRKSQAEYLADKSRPAAIFLAELRGERARRNKRRPKA